MKKIICFVAIIGATMLLHSCESYNSMVDAHNRFVEEHNRVVNEWNSYQ